MLSAHKHHLKDLWQEFVWSLSKFFGQLLPSANEVAERGLHKRVSRFMSTAGGVQPLGRHLPGQTPPPQGQSPPGQTPPPADTPQADGYCSGRYASYWNAFLFLYSNLFLSPLVDRLVGLFLQSVFHHEVFSEVQWTKAGQSPLSFQQCPAITTKQIWRKN